VLEPCFAPSLLPDTFACLPGRGTHRAILRHEALMRRHRFLLQLEVRKYFLSISHARLMHLLARRVRDERVLALCRTLLEAEEGLYTGAALSAQLGDPTFVPREGHGIAIGTLTSQFWGNLYLSALDHFIKRTLKVPGYLRYMDNLTLFSSRRADLRTWQRLIGRFLEEELDLELAPGSGRIVPCTAKVDYLGYRVGRAGHAPGARALDRFRRRLRRYVAGVPSCHAIAGQLEPALWSFRGVMAF
jgi:retron-type reverse transcriptase